MSSTPEHGVDDTRDRGPKIIGLACGFLAASLLVGVLRLGVRISRRLQAWDDACIIIAMLFSILQTISACMSEHHGYGKPVKTLTADELRSALFWFYIAQVAYKGIIWPSKLSILILYRRVFGDTPNVRSYGLNFRIVVICLSAFAILFFFISEIVTIFTCVPVQRYWDKRVTGVCQVNPISWWFAQSIFNTVSDILILTLPMPLIHHLLQVPRRQKIGLMMVFGLGLFVTICTVVRMTTFKTGAKGADTTYDGAITLMWTIIETNVAIICACLPLLRPLIARLIPGFNKSRSGSRSKSNTYPLHNRYGMHGDNSTPCGISSASNATNTSSSRHHDPQSKAGEGGVFGGLNRSWGEWKESGTTVMATKLGGTTTVHRTGSDDSQIGIARASRDFGGITKQTDVDITMEAASMRSVAGDSENGHRETSQGGSL